jgi:hypothetical protein
MPTALVSSIENGHTTFEHYKYSPGRCEPFQFVPKAMLSHSCTERQLLYLPINDPTASLIFQGGFLYQCFAISQSIRAVPRLDHPIPAIQQTMPDRFTPELLNRTLQALGLSADPALFAQLANAYHSPGRHYHSDRHHSLLAGDQIYHTSEFSRRYEAQARANLQRVILVTAKR